MRKDEVWYLEKMLAMSIYKDDRCERDETVIDGKEGSSQGGICTRQVVCFS
jgi:hypothetical protein